MSDDPYMKATVWFCSECMKPSGDDTWDGAWHDELRRRKNDPEFDADEYGKDLGLYDRMVCPRCKFVHAE